MENLKEKNKELTRIFCEFKENNMDSYDFFYKEYYSLIYGIVFSILKNKENTEDVVQEIFMKIYNLDRTKLPENGVSSWIYTVSKNETFNYLRRKKKEVDIEDIYELQEESSEIEEIIDIYTYNKIISGLNEKEKEIVSLKILSNFTFKKIGQMLQMPTATVQWRYYKAVDSLKISLGNLALSIITFILLIVRKENMKSIDSKSEEKKENLDLKSSENKEQDLESKENIESTIIEDKSETSTNNKLQESDNNSYNEVYNVLTGDNATIICEKEETLDIVQPTLIGICAIFLSISIIFAIFFKNHQQKRKKKASK